MDRTSPLELMSKVTDQVPDDMQAWQARPLDSIYPVILIDALVVQRGLQDCFGEVL